MYKICVPVSGSNLKQFLDNLVHIQSRHDFVELQLDSIAGLNVTDLDIIRKTIKVKAIASFRIQEELVNFGVSQHDQLDYQLAILAKCLQLSFDYIDIDFTIVKNFCLPIKNPKNKPKKKSNQILEVVDPTKLNLNIKSPNTKLIFSYYNPKNTNNYRFLRRIQDQMKGLGCDIQKIICKVNTNEDLKILTRLLTSKTTNEQLIVLGIGQLSTFLSVQGLLLGNYLTFAVLDENQSKITGQTTEQTTLQEIKSALKLLG